MLMFGERPLDVGFSVKRGGSRVQVKGDLGF